jgi:hypothetical protein
VRDPLGTANGILCCALDAPNLIAGAMSCPSGQ